MGLEPLGLSEFDPLTRSELIKKIAELQRQMDEAEKQLAELEEENRGWVEGYGLLLKKESQIEARLNELDKQKPFGYLCDWGDYNGEQRVHMYYGEPGSAIEDDWNDYPRIHHNLPLYAIPPNLPAMIEQARAEEREACAKVCESMIENIDENYAAKRPDEAEGDYIANAVKQNCADAIRARGEKK